MNARVLLPALVVSAFACGLTQRAGADVACPLPRVAILTATTNAPAGAGGFASLFPVPWMTPDIVFPITNAPAVRVTTEGLLVGTYTVSVTDTATNTYVLGTFDVVTVTNPVEVLCGQSTVPPIPPPPVVITLGSGTFPLPAGLDATNVVGVSVSDAGGLVDLTGTFKGLIIPPPPPPVIYETAELIATTNAPADAVGYAVLSSGGPWATPMDIAFPATNASSVRVTANGLLVGTYTVSVTDTATNTYVLGMFNIIAVTPLYLQVGSAPPSSITVGSGDFPLPAGLDATNVVGVTVADAAGAVDLAGTFHGPVVQPPPREFREFVLLAGTTNAPAGAMGRAALEVESDEGTNTATLEVEASGLLVGTYMASITDTATNTYALGTFDVTVRTNRFDGPPRPSVIVAWTNTCAFGEADFPLPAGVDPTNVVTVAIADANGLVDLTGDFTNPPRPIPCSFNTVVPLTPGPGGPNLWGNAWLEIKVLKGKTRAKFSLTAYGLPANTTVYLVVNGAQVGTVKSNRHGVVRLKKLPKGIDLTGLTSVQAEDDGGHVVFSASF